MHVHYKNIEDQEIRQNIEGFADAFSGEISSIQEGKSGLDQTLEGAVYAN